MHIEIWDDDHDAAKRWKAKIDSLSLNSEARTRAATPREIDESLNVLHERRRVYLGNSAFPHEHSPSVVDETDVLIVDNDLFKLPQHADFSAETVANLVGVYTDCAYIVVLNSTPDIDFDLTMLGHPDSRADLHMNDRLVDDPGLWRECPKQMGAFRPWHWPLLASAVDLYRARVAEIVAILRNQPDTPILDYLGFNDAARSRLSRTARSFLHRGQNLAAMTFGRYIEDNTSAVGPRDGAKICQRNDVMKIARIGARHIAKWIAQYVLGPQEVLIDLPHLVQRLPFLVPEKEQASGDYWNSFAQLKGAPVERVDGYGIEPLRRDNWCDRPVFWADAVESQENVCRLVKTIDVNPQRLVFCEDSSAFHVVDSCDRFVAAHNTMSDDRFVRWFSEPRVDWKYGPQIRLAM